MQVLSKQRVCLFVDRSTGQWVVRDPEGSMWVVPTTDNPWEQREPFAPVDDTALEVIPGHYKSMFNLPF